MTAADDPRAYHRRIESPIHSSDRVPTLCGRVVNYQQANGSLTNVDCPECIANADSLVNFYVLEMAELLKPTLERLRRARSS